MVHEWWCRSPFQSRVQKVHWDCLYWAMNRKAGNRILDKYYTRSETPWFIPLGISKKFGVHFSGGYWRGTAASCSKFLYLGPKPSRHFFSASVNPRIIGSKLVWKRKANILGMCCNLDRGWYLLSVECETTFFLNCSFISWKEHFCNS
jgi:hypothetical protein